LRLKVDIPEAFTIEPQLVMWRIGEPPQPKTIRIAASKEYPGKIVSVESDNQSVKLDLREIHPGKELEVKVTPQGTTRAVAATLLIRTDYPPANPETHYAYARVK
jgi:TusA-related sulfurtransferase